MGMPAPVYYTADMVRDLPEEGNRYEVVYGELLVTPAPRLQHQELVRRLLVALSRYLEANPVARRERLVWLPAGAGRPFTLALDELFRPL
jgi:Uma2 family endonuclease